MNKAIDPRSTANARLAIDETVDLLVVGAGPAGLAAALEAAAAGLSVIVADENPVPAETMGSDVPLHFGGRMSGAVRNRTAVTEALLASEPLLEPALEAGIDVRLGTAVWGLFGNGHSVSWLPGLVAGLSDGARSTMLACKSAIVAAGRRDMGLAFSGWERPGVMGATAAERLATRYGALDARRAVVLGTGAEALLAALAMHRAGIDVAAIVEQAEAPIGPAALLEDVRAGGIPVRTGHVIIAADGDGDGVTAARIAPLADRSAVTRIDCDTIVLGIGAVPVIELLDAAGAASAWTPARGGHAPVLDARQMTVVRGLYAAGDCAGVWPEKSMDRSVAEAEGRRAARAAAQLEVSAAAEPAHAPPAGYRLDWVRHATVEGSSAEPEPHVCLCEEVTAREILEVRPPRYLQWDHTRRNSTDLTALLGEGAPSPDQVKRLTRAGMGVCQGRRCREQVAVLLALGAGTELGAVPLATFRAPVRPMPLGIAGAVPEPEEMARHWHVWFGIEGQVTPYWELAGGARARVDE